MTDASIVMVIGTRIPRRACFAYEAGVISVMMQESDEASTSRDQEDLWLACIISVHHVALTVMSHGTYKDICFAC